MEIYSSRRKVDVTVTAILISASEYKDYDRKVELYSMEEGLITAVMRGVRKANAKLKFACQPFAFCVYELTRKNGYFTVTGATALEDMFALTRKTDRYICACAIMEILKVTAQAVDSKDMFVIMLKTLKTLLYAKTNEYVATAKFAQKVVSLSGFTINRIVHQGHVENGEQLLDFISSKYLDDLELFTCEQEIAKSALSIQLKRIEKLFDCKLNTLKFI